MIPSLEEVLLLGVISFSILWLTWKKRFFFIQEEKSLISLRWFDPIAVFAVYIVLGVIATPLVVLLEKSLLTASPVAIYSCATFFTSFFVLLGIGVYSFVCAKKNALKIWNQSIQPNYLKDISTGLICCAIGFPLVLFISELMDLLLYLMFHVTQLPDQVAVLFLKMTFGHPLYFFMTILTITVLAPCIEETLFRGFLQSFLSQHLGVKSSLFLTSLSFSLFHYSSEQGWANIPIIASLFILALFLGFIYEKRRSLLAPITLHASFNSISVLNLYLLEGLGKTGS